METAKHPATVLGTLDAIGILVLWVHFRSQINELRRLCEDKSDTNTTLRENVKIQFERVATNLRALDERMKEIGAHTIAHKRAIISLEERVARLEQKLQLQVSKGDTDHMPHPKSSILTAPRTHTRPSTPSTELSSSTIAEEEEEEEETTVQEEEPEQEDEVDFIVALAKKKKANSEFNL